MRFLIMLRLQIHVAVEEMQGGFSGAKASMQDLSMGKVPAAADLGDGDKSEFTKDLVEVIVASVLADIGGSGKTDVSKGDTALEGGVEDDDDAGVVPWDTVDVVLFPVNLKKNHHWCLIEFDIIERCLNVYDSFPKRGDNYEVSNIVEMFSTILPLYLDITKFYDKQTDLLNTLKYKKLKVTD